MKENQIGSCQKCLLVKTYEWHKKSFTGWFNQERPGSVEVEVCATTKRKIILSWPNGVHFIFAVKLKFYFELYTT